MKMIKYLALLLPLLSIHAAEILPFTNSVPAATTNQWAQSTNSYFSVGRSNTSIFMSFFCATNTGTLGLGNSSNCVVQYDVSPDLQLWYTDARYRHVLAQNGTNAVSGWTNFDTSGFNYMRINSFENSATNIKPTNIVIQRFYKP